MTIGARKLGNQSIFRDKAGGDRVQGQITKRGAEKFRDAKKALAGLVFEVTGERRRWETISDADAIEFLARGERETVVYLKQRD